MQDIILNPENIEAALSEKVKSKKKVTNPNKIASEILSVKHLIYTAESFFEYKNGVYVPVEENELKQIVKGFIGDDYRPSKFKDVKDCLITDTLVNISCINDFSDKVNLGNGVLNLNSTVLSGHSPDQIYTIKLNVKFDAAAKCPKWEAFLEQMLGDDLAKIELIQEYFGYCLDYNANNESIMFFLGRGANGKSVCLDVLKTVLGDGSYSVVCLDDFSKSHYLAILFGKLVNISSESNVRGETCESVFKRLASSEELVVDRKYGHPFKFKPTCKHIYAMNNLPRVSDKTKAFFRRVIPIPFNKEVKREEKIFKFGELIAKEEGSGILNWMIEGRRRLLANRGEFTVSSQVCEVLDNYKRENNNVLDFVDEECVVDEDCFTEISALYEKYREYCKAGGMNALKKRGFVKELVDNTDGVDRRKGGKGSRGLDGIGLNYVAPF